MFPRWEWNRGTTYLPYIVALLGLAVPGWMLGRLIIWAVDMAVQIIPHVR